MASAKGAAPGVVFREAIDAADHLRWMAGLQAIKAAEGGGQVEGQDPRSVLGGARIDDDCRAAYPTDPRWDYVVGYGRASLPIAYFIEVHGAETSDVSEVEKKLMWLRRYLELGSQKRLRGLPREIYWVASGRINIPRHVPQFKYLVTTLRKLGLKGPVKHLVLT